MAAKKSEREIVEESILKSKGLTRKTFRSNNLQKATQTLVLEKDKPDNADFFDAIDRYYMNQLIDEILKKNIKKE